MTTTNEPQCPCFVCETSCIDWNVKFNITDYICLCGNCNRIIFPSRDYEGDNGFIGKSSPYKYGIVLKLREQWQKAKCIAITGIDLGIGNSITIYPEKPCVVCQKLNDQGNPAVKKCWNCESLL